MPVTMRDVAEKAGVSIRTVSRVVNKRKEVSDTTRARVSAAIETLGYRPSKVAQAMVTHRTETIGLIVGDITNPYFTEFTRGVMDVAEDKGYSVFVCNSDGDPNKELDTLESLAMHSVDGIILFSCYKNGAKLGNFAATAAPLVIINRPFQYPKIGLVLTKIAQGAKLAVDYLVSQGHSAIAMIAGAVPLDKMQRAKGFRDALRAHGLPVVEDWILPGSPDFAHGVEATQHLLTKHPEVTAIFCYNDMIAMGAIQACKDTGHRIPDACAIVGFDNIQFAAMADPPLTTIHIDKYGLGQQAFQSLLAILQNPDIPVPPVYADVELVVRKSA